MGVLLGITAAMILDPVRWALTLLVMLVVWRSFRAGRRAIPLAIGLLLGTVAVHLFIVSMERVGRSAEAHTLSLVLGVACSYIMVGIVIGIRRFFKKPAQQEEARS